MKADEPQTTNAVRERILTPLAGMPDTLTDNERAARMAAFDAFNNPALFPEPMDDWCVLSPEYRAMQQPVLHAEEIYALIEARGSDWRGLVGDAYALMEGNQVYKDIHAARAVFAYVYAHCPDDVHTDGEFCKYDALFYLAWSYFRGEATDDPGRAIYYYNELLATFSGDYRVGDPAVAFKQIYFTHPLYHLYAAYMAAGQTTAAQDALARLKNGIGGFGAEAEAAFAMCRLRGELRADVFAATAAGRPTAELEHRFVQQEQRLTYLLAMPHMSPHTRAKAAYDLDQTRKALRFIRQQKIAAEIGP